MINDAGVAVTTNVSGGVVARYVDIVVVDIDDVGVVCDWNIFYGVCHGAIFW